MNGVVSLGVETANYDYIKSYVVVIEAPADPTSISANSISADFSDAHYYDLQGHRLSAQPSALVCTYTKERRWYSPFTIKKNDSPEWFNYSCPTGLSSSEEFHDVVS